MTRVTNGAVWLLAMAVALGLSAAPGVCQEGGTTASEGPSLDIRGFGGWALGHTSNDNLYPDSPVPVASNDWEYDNTYFTLNLLARPLAKVTILAQPTWQSTMRGREVRLDLAYAEVTLTTDLFLRAGKIKNPLGLYTAIYKVGTLRPFYLLPNVYYRLVPENYTGLGVNRLQRVGSWELELDALGGQMDFEPFDSDLPVGIDPGSMAPIFASLPVTIRGRDVIGGGLLLRPPVKGLQLGASAYTMRLYGSVAGSPMAKLSDERQKAYTGSLEYLTDKISLRAEALFTRGYIDDDAAYVEAAYYLTSHWQVAATYQYLEASEPPPIVESLNKDRTYGVALNYWMSPKFVWKVDYYHVKYNRAARPLDAINAALGGTLETETDVFVAGLHFAF